MSAINSIFPRARAEIIRLLFPDPARRLHLRDLVRQSGLAVRTLQQEVAKLTAVDLLLEERDGNRRYFRANAEHPIFPELQGIAVKTTGLHDQLEKALAGLEGVQLAFVYGSLASGEATSSSDIDILVIGTVGLRVLAPRLREVSDTLLREVNPHILSSETLARKTRAGDAFVRNVLQSPKLWIQGNDDELKQLAEGGMASPS